MAEKYGKKDMVIIFLILLCLYLYSNCNRTMEGMIDDFELPDIIDDDEELSEELLEMEEEGWDSEFEESELAANNADANNAAANTAAENAATNVPSYAENAATNVPSDAENAATNVPSNATNVPSNAANTAAAGNTR